MHGLLQWTYLLRRGAIVLIELTWLGQMGLLIRTPHTTLCIDYYADPAPRRLV